MMSEVAVVIPLYNGETWIHRTLESVLAQTYAPAEIVVVDDGSSDRSLAVASHFSEVTPLHNPDKGANTARQFGFINTAAPLVAFLDQDDAWHPEHLESLVAALERYPKSPSAIADISWFSSDESPSFSVEEKAPIPLDPWERFPRCPIPTPSGALIRRAALDEMGGWPTRFIGVADFYTWLRLSVHHPLVLSRSTTAAHRRHEKSHSAIRRMEQAPRYLRDQIEAAEDALTHRLAATSENETLLRRRLQILPALLQVLEAIWDTRPASIAEAAYALEARLEEETDRFIGGVCGQLLWYLGPVAASGTPAQRRAVLNALFVHWPAGASRTRQRLQARAKQSWSGWAFLQYLANRPTQPVGWRLVKDVIQSRVQRRIG